MSMIKKKYKPFHKIYLHYKRAERSNCNNTNPGPKYVCVLLMSANILTPITVPVEDIRYHTNNWVCDSRPNTPGGWAKKSISNILITVLKHCIGVQSHRCTFQLNGDIANTLVIQTHSFFFPLYICLLLSGSPGEHGFKACPRVFHMTEAGNWTTPSCS